MELYQKIVDCLPHKLLSKRSIEKCATNIYLTATGVRPATFPFDIKKKRPRYTYRSNPSSLERDFAKDKSDTAVESLGRKVS